MEMIWSNKPDVSLNEKGIDFAVNSPVELHPVVYDHGSADDIISEYIDRQEKELRDILIGINMSDGFWSSEKRVAVVKRSGNIITLSFRADFLFEPGTNIPKLDAFMEIGLVASLLMRYIQTVVWVEAYVEADDSDENAQRLSEARAEMVREALVHVGIDLGRIEAIGLVKPESVSLTDMINRNVNIVIIPAFNK
jgi:outer membrane protein OmpA-like peptidoglycan-associated protein